MCSHPARQRPLLLTLLATIALVIGSAGHAHAQPSPAEIEAEIDKKWNEIEPVIEEHNAVRIKLETERGKADALAAQLAPLEQEVAKTRVRVGAYADYMYRGGRAIGISSFLSSGNPTIMAERLSSMEQVTAHFNARIGEVLAAKNKLDEAKRPLDELVAQLDALDKEQAARIALIKDEIKKLDQMRIAAYGTGGGTGNLRPVPCPVTVPGGQHSTAVKFACEQIGKPYVFAQDGPDSFDCSGLTKAAWLKAGISLPHNAKAQRAAVPRISRSELIPGDLVFYYSDLHHVAMYAGKYEGVDWIVHASRSGVPLQMRKMDNGYIHSYGRPGG